MSAEELPAKFRGLPGGLLFEGWFTICLNAVLLCSVGVSSLAFMASISASYLRVTNEENVNYFPTHNGTVVPGAVLLIPEYTVEIGMLHFTIGASAFSRKQWNLLPLEPLSHPTGPIDQALPEDIRVAYANVRNNALQFGYAAAESCGGMPATTIMSRSRFVVAATLIGTMCGLGITVVASLFLFHLRRESATPKNKVCVERKCRIVKLSRGTELEEFIASQKAEQQWERSVIIALIAFSVVGTTFLVSAEVVEYHLRSSALRCGKSFCCAYEDAMHRLLQLLWVSGDRFSCQVGYSSVVLLVGTILKVLLFVIIMGLSVLHLFMGHALVARVSLGAGSEKRPRENRLRNPMEASFLFFERMSPGNNKLDSIFSAENHTVATDGLDNGGDVNCSHHTCSMDTETDALKVAEAGNDCKSSHFCEQGAIAKEEEAARVDICREQEFVFCVQFR